MQPKDHLEWVAAHQVISVSGVAERKSLRVGGDCFQRVRDLGVKLLGRLRGCESFSKSPSFLQNAIQLSYMA